MEEQEEQVRTPEANDYSFGPLGDAQGPEPTEAQDWLWENIEGALSDRAIARARDFTDLSEDARAKLASVELAGTIGKLEAQFAFTPEHTAKLSALLKYLYLRRFRKTEFARITARILDLTPEQMGPIEEALRDVLEASDAFKPLEKKARTSAIAPELDALPRVVPQRFSAEGTREEEPPTPPLEEPFILHEEKSLADTANETTPRETRSSFSFTPPETGGQKSQRPVTVRIETETEKPKARVVHYSKLRTPLENESQ